MRSLVVLMLGLGCAGCSMAPLDSGGDSSPVVADPTWTSGYGPGGYYSDSARQSYAAGDVSGATQNFEQALKINPFDPVALNNLAVAKAEQGEFHEALDLLERAARLAPDNYEISANVVRLRDWTQNYALDSGVPGQAVQSLSSGGFDNLPPPPPPLWSAQ